MAAVSLVEECLVMGGCKRVSEHPQHTHTHTHTHIHTHDDKHFSFVYTSKAPRRLGSSGVCGAFEEVLELKQTGRHEDDVK